MLTIIAANCDIAADTPSNLIRREAVAIYGEFLEQPPATVIIKVGNRDDVHREVKLS